MKNVILVDRNDRKIAIKEKLAAHTGRGILHRAFSILIFNKKREILIQKRSKYKFLWPKIWSNACCSHPEPNKPKRETAKQRLKEELGFTCDLRFIGKFQYAARYRNIGAENEVCSVFVGKYDGKITPNPMEVEAIQWISLPKLKKDMERHPQKYTPWFKIEIKKFNYETH